jgi:predicted Fe-S protein YdhL (DUF1289 family)
MSAAQMTLRMFRPLSSASSLPQVVRTANFYSGEPMSTKNPCISICKFDDDICIGCGRSKREVKSWKKMDKDERRSVVADSVQRLRTLKSSARRKKK